jgi:hypothetical protein
MRSLRCFIGEGDSEGRGAGLRLVLEGLTTPLELLGLGARCAKGLAPPCHAFCGCGFLQGDQSQQGVHAESTIGSQTKVKEHWRAPKKVR